MRAEFITPSDCRWQKCLQETRYDFYHRPEYMAFAAKYEGGTPLAFYAENGSAKFLAPILVRDIPLTAKSWKDSTTPYGYSSPLLVSTNPDKDSISFFKAFKEAGQSLSLVSAFFRLHPLLPLPSKIQQCGELVTHGLTVSVDLTLPTDQFWAQTRAGHRYEISRAIDAGFEVCIDCWKHYADFMSIYTATMSRLNASSFYFFSNEYFKELKETLSTNLHLCSVIAPNGEVAAAGLFTEMCGMVQYHLSGAKTEYRKLAPAKLMLHHVRQWAKTQGYETLHLGGGVGARNDSLFRFKSGFSRGRNRFRTLRVVLDEDKYETLNALWCEKSDSTDDSDSGFFPFYRQPIGIEAE